MNRLSNLKNMFYDSAVLNNPVFIQVLGTCPTLAVTTSVKNGIGMGIAATAVLICSNLAISILRNFIPGKIRIAAYVVVIASFVTMTDLLMQAFTPALSKSLGIFIPLIVVNCIILARAEAFASKNAPLPSILDGLFMGIGFTFALFLFSTIREILGNGTFLDINIMPHGFQPAIIFILPPGGFLVFGFLIAAFNWFVSRKEAK